MKDSRYFYGGPVWTVNSQEMFMGLVFWILIFLIPVYPMLNLGLFIGGVIGVKLSFVIFPPIFIALGYLILIFLKKQYGIRAMLLFFIFEYVSFDYITAVANSSKSLIIVEKYHSIIAWCISPIAT